MSETIKELYIEYDDHSFIYFDTMANNCHTAFRSFEQALTRLGINTDNVKIKPVRLELRQKYDNDAIDTLIL